MTGTTHTSIHPIQDNFDTDEFSIGIDNFCSVTMYNPKQDFVVTLKKGWRVINVFEGPKLHTIYEGTINWNINNNSGNPHQVEIHNYFWYRG